MQARIFADEALLEQTTIEIADEESVSFDSESIEDQGLPDVKPRDLEEYLRRLNPEDFGRFTP